MINEMITKINKEISQEEVAVYLNYQRETINSMLSQLYDTLELDPLTSTIDDVLAKLEEDGDLEDCPEMQPIFEWVKEAQRVLENPPIPNPDKEEALKQSVEAITTQYNKFISAMPDHREEIVSALIQGIINPAEGINATVQSGGFTGLNLGQEEIVLQQSLLETQQHIANMNISEEEFMKLPIARIFIREVVTRHRKAGHILTLLSINNWKSDVTELIESNGMDTEEILQVIESYDMTKAEYEDNSFAAKKKATLLFIENLQLADEDKATLFETANNHIQARENDYLQPFYQQRIGEELIFGGETQRKLGKK